MTADDGRRICPPDHPHARTTTCHTSHGCGCTDCRAAHRDYMYFRRHMLAAGRDVFNRPVDALGAQRRIQALMCLGWSQSELERRYGIPQTLLSAQMQGRNITQKSHDRIAAIYDDLSHLIPPTATAGQRMSVNRTKALARRNRWAPPLAWDDIDNDSAPAATARTADLDEVAIERALIGDKVKLTPAERRACVRILHARRYSDGRAADLLHCDQKTVARIRDELDLPAHDQNDLIDRSAA